MSSSWAANAIAAIHVVFVAWMLCAPWSNHSDVRAAFLVLTPFIWLHWILNDSTCALTLLECKLRGVPATASFVHRIVAPVYSIGDSTVQRVSWAVTVALWLRAARVTSSDDVRRALGLAR